MYLANDVIQKSKKTCPEFVNKFGEVMPEVLEHVARCENKNTIQKILRVLQIWVIRRIYVVCEMLIYTNCLGKYYSLQWEKIVTVIIYCFSSNGDETLRKEDARRSKPDVGDYSN